MKIPKQHIVVLTGAGISAESGIKPFRGDNGLWNDYDSMLLDTAAGFSENPEAVLNFHNQFRKTVYNAEPNEAHKLLAELEKWFNVTIITQNVDNLHERAGSTNVIHLHGELQKVTSSANRQDINSIKEYPLDTPIKIGDIAADGSQLRPYVVWYDEYIDSTIINNAKDCVKNADIFVVIGTSLTVQPAKNLINYPHREIPKYVIDTAEIKLLGNYHHIRMPATEGVLEFVELCVKEHLMDNQTCMSGRHATK